MGFAELSEKASVGAKEALETIRRSWKASSPWQMAMRAYAAAFVPWWGGQLYWMAEYDRGWRWLPPIFYLGLVFWVATLTILDYDMLKRYKKLTEEYDEFNKRSLEQTFRLIAENAVLRARLEGQNRTFLH